MKEIWKDIKGYEGIYQVSSTGKIKSLKRTVIRTGRPMNLSEMIMKLQKDAKGYLSIDLLKSGKNKRIKIHRIVASAFIPNPLNKPQVNHINGNKSDNRVENLEWSTESENQKHAYKIGLKKPKIGIKNPRCVLTEKQVKQILNDTRSYKDIHKEYPISLSMISRIKVGRAWNSVTGLPKVTESI